MKTDIEKEFNYPSVNFGHQKVKCEKGNNSSHIFFDNTCKHYAFVCQIKTCECRKSHKNCTIMEVLQLQRNILKNCSSLKPIEDELNSKFQKFIEQISDLRQRTIQQFRQKYEYSFLTGQQQALIKSLRSGSSQNINCKLVWKAYGDVFLQNKNDVNANILRDRISEILKSYQQQSKHLKAKLQKFFNQPKNQFFDNKNNVYRDENGWIRIMMKKQNSIITQFGSQLEAKDIQNMKIKGIGWSNNPETMNTSESWYFNEVSFTSNTGLQINQVIANIFNGKTPTGTAWSLNYQGGYLHYSGIISTYGTFTSFYMGWNWTTHITIGTQTSLRTGGGKNHTGEWIHSSCNGYSEKQHSITSRIGWNNTRVFWVKIN